MWPTVAATVLTALCCTACGTPARLSEQRLWQEMKMEVRAQPLPEVTAQIALPMDELRALPEGVAVERRNQRARAILERRGDTLMVRATCDSMLRQVTIYGERKAEGRKANNDWKILLVIIVVAVGIGSILRRK